MGSPPCGQNLVHRVSSGQPKGDPSLIHLREEIKKVMLPLLIRVFELKQAAGQAVAPPTRLMQVTTEPLEKIQDQLKNLSEDLRLLSLWCQSSQNQVLKAIKEIEALSSLSPLPPDTEKMYSDVSEEKREDQVSSSSSHFSFIKRFFKGP